MEAHHTTSSGPAAESEVVAYAELLHRAHEDGLKFIHTELIAQPHEENGHRCIVRALVETKRGRFEGIGDADPTNVEPFLAPHLIRVAETRAKARALRDAVNVGITSFEELDGVRPNSGGSPGSGATARPIPTRSSNGSTARGTRSNGQDGPMSEAQRRYLFRLLAGKGYQGQAAEDYLHTQFEVPNLNQVSRRQASELIDQLLASAPGNGGGGRGATAGHQR